MYKRYKNALQLEVKMFSCTFLCVFYRMKIYIFLYFKIMGLGLHVLDLGDGYNLFYYYKTNVGFVYGCKLKLPLY